jgi:hypothetical protein
MMKHLGKVGEIGIALEHTIDADPLVELDVGGNDSVYLTRIEASFLSDLLRHACKQLERLEQKDKP